MICVAYLGNKLRYPIIFANYKVCVAERIVTANAARAHSCGNLNLLAPVST